MELFKHTLSVCPTCIKEIPATITINNTGAIMHKTCPEHGDSQGVVEKDATFYLSTELFDGNGFPGTFVNVTDRCNIRCKYCFYQLDEVKPDRSINSILEECRTVGLPPFQLLGGEPTMREDLPELITAIKSIGPVCLVTNGIKLADDDYLGRLLDAGLHYDKRALIAISLHTEENNVNGEYPAKIQAIENIIRRGLSVDVSFAIDSLDQLDEVIAVRDKYRGNIVSSRVRLVGNVGASKNAPDQLFISEAYQYLLDKAEREGKAFTFDAEATLHTPEISCYWFDGHHIVFVKFWDKNNIDLNDVRSPPYSMNKDGRIVRANYALLMDL